MQEKKVTDHLGHEYKNIREMSAFYGISYDVYYKRVSNGWSLEAALTTPVKSNSANHVKDHLGKEYGSYAVMCRAYGISRGVLFYRMNNGMSLEDALTSKLRKGPVPRGSKQVKDHLGNVYPNFSSMCSAYGVSLSAFSKRVGRGGWSLERALTEKGSAEVEFEGKTYKSLAKLCEAFKISVKTYQKRTEEGMTMEEALKKKPFYDHLGNGFDCLEDMLSAYDLPLATYHYRLRKRWSLEDILTAEKNSRHFEGEERGIIDPYGKKFKNSREMCKAHGTCYATYLQRRRDGLSVEECLFGKRKRNSNTNV